MLKQKILVGIGKAGIKCMECGIEIEKKVLERDRKRVTKLCESIRNQKVRIMEDEAELRAMKSQVNVMEAELKCSDVDVVDSTAFVMA